MGSTRAASRRSPGARRSRSWTDMTNPPGRRTGGMSSRSSVAATISVGRNSLVLALGLVAGCALKGDVRTELLSVQQQLVSVQELTGQSQQRLTELRTRIEARAQQPDPVVAAGGAPVGPSGNPAGPGPDQMYDVALQQYRRGSVSTARLGFREFLRVFPTHERER